MRRFWLAAIALLLLSGFLRWVEAGETKPREFVEIDSECRYLSIRPNLIDVLGSKTDPVESQGKKPTFYITVQSGQVYYDFCYQDAASRDKALAQIRKAMNGAKE